MAIAANAYKVVKRAAQIRVSRGESVDEVVASYPKLSAEQAKQLKSELSNTSTK